MKTTSTFLVICASALVAVGLVMLYSATMGVHRIWTQLIALFIGTVGCATVAAVDYRHWRSLAVVLIVVSVVALGAVLVPGIGQYHGGARRWFKLGPLSFQPSELAKLAVVVGLAYYGERFQRLMPTFWRGLVLPGLGVGVVMGLVFVEPDRGTTILMAAVAGSLLLVAGVRWRHILPFALTGAALLTFSLVNDPMRLRRLLSWWNLEGTKRGVGYQAYEAMLALGSGGLTGLGLGNGRQKLGFVPEQHSDFIFSIIGEELGLIGTVAVVLAFVGLIICGLYIAWHARDTFGFLLGSGLTLLVGFQAFINIGVVTSALPNKGLPLPFISFGGSNLILMLGCVGLLLSIARHATAHRTLGSGLLGPEKITTLDFDA